MPTRNYDIFLEHSGVKVPYKIAKDGDGNIMYSEKLAPLIAQQQFQGQFGDESINANVDIPMSFEDWHHGSGTYEIDTSDLGPGGHYNYSQGVDASWVNRLYLSPELQTGGSTTQNPIKFVYSTYGLHCLTTRYIYEWTGAAWTQRFDNTNKTNEDLIEYKNSRGTYLVLVLSDADYYLSTDGVTFSQPNNGDLTPTFRSYSMANSTSTKALTISKPSDVQQNDVMFASLVSHNSIMLTAPTGWALIESREVEASKNYIYWKRVAASEPDDYTWVNNNTSVPMIGTIAAYKGCTTSGTPYEGLAYTQAGSGTSIPTSNQQTSSGSNRTILTLILGGINFSGTTNSFTVASGYTERADTSVTDGASTIFSYVADKVGQNSGAVSAATFTSAQSATIALNTQYLLIPPSEAERLNNGKRLAIRGSDDGEPILWCVDSNSRIRQTPDPTTPGYWSSADLIQFSQGATVAGLEVLDNTFYLMTNKGIDSYNGTTVSTVWASDLHYSTDMARPFVWGDRRLYFTYGGALFAYEHDQQLIERVWPRGRQIGNDELNGIITSITGDSRNLYFTIKNSDGNFYIMKGDPQHSATIEGELFYPFHSWVYRSTGDVYAMLAVPAASDTMHASNPQLVIGDDTTADYLILPRYGLRPEDDSNYRFDTSVGTIYGPWVDAGAKTWNKFLNVGTVVAENVSASLPIVQKYEIDNSGTPVTIQTVTSSGLSNTEITATDVEYARIRYIMTLDTNANTSSPRLIAHIFHSSLNPPRKLMWVLGVEMANEQEMRTGGDSRYGWRKQLAHLRAGLTERVKFYDKRGDTWICKILDYSNSSIDNDENRDIYEIVLVELVNP